MIHQKSHCINQCNIDYYFGVNISFMLYKTFKMIRTNWYDKGESIIARELQGDLFIDEKCLIDNADNATCFHPLCFWMIRL